MLAWCWAWLEVGGRLNAGDYRTEPARTLGVGPCGACVRAAHLRGAPRSDASRLHHSRIHPRDRDACQRNA